MAIRLLGDNIMTVNQWRNLLVRVIWPNQHGNFMLVAQQQYKEIIAKHS